MSEDGKMKPRRLQSDTRASMRLVGTGGVAIGKASVPAARPAVNSAVAGFGPGRQVGRQVMKRRQLLALIAWSLAAAGPMGRAGDATPPERVPPRVVSQVQPTYPEALAASGIKGEVLVGFIVDRDGNVADPFVITSSN